MSGGTISANTGLLQAGAAQLVSTPGRGRGASGEGRGVTKGRVATWKHARDQGCGRKPGQTCSVVATKLYLGLRARLASVRRTPSPTSPLLQPPPPTCPDSCPPAPAPDPPVISSSVA